MAADYQSLGLALSQQQTGLVLEVVDSLDSTNSELMRRARAGIGQPTLLVAQHQTAGRGRLGRQWLSQEHHTGSEGSGAAGESLTFSLVLPLTVADWSGLSLAVGLSLASSLHPDLRLKWPNDIWLEQRKLAGILIETVAIGSARLAIVGVGINLGPRGARDWPGRLPGCKRCCRRSMRPPPCCAWCPGCCARCKNSSPLALHHSGPGLHSAMRCLVPQSA